MLTATEAKDSIAYYVKTGHLPVGVTEAQIKESVKAFLAKGGKIPADLITKLNNKLRTNFGAAKAASVMSVGMGASPKIVDFLNQTMSAASNVPTGSVSNPAPIELDGVTIKSTPTYWWLLWVVAIAFAGWYFLIKPKKRTFNSRRGL